MEGNERVLKAGLLWLSQTGAIPAPVSSQHPCLRQLIGSFFFKVALQRLAPDEANGTMSRTSTTHRFLTGQASIGLRISPAEHRSSERRLVNREQTTEFPWQHGCRFLRL